MKLRWKADKRKPGRQIVRLPAKKGAHGPCHVMISKMDGDLFWSASCAINPDGSGFSYSRSGDAKTIAKAKSGAAAGLREVKDLVRDHYR